MANQYALKMAPHCRGFPSYSPAAATRLRKSAILTASKILDCLRKIVDGLPYSLNQKLCDFVDSITQKEARDPNRKDLTDFVEVGTRVTNHPIFGKVKVEQKSNNSKFVNLYFRAVDVALTLRREE